MNFIKKYGKYFVLFVVVLLGDIFFRCAFYDSAVQYGMAHAIRMGEYPYLDFNTVSTPLYIFVMSIPLFICDNYIIYLIFSSLLTVAIYYYADKIIKYHKLTFVLVSFLPFFDVICPSYNLLTKFLIVLLIYLEMNQKKDFLIGIFLGLCILSKQSIGVFIAFMGMVYAFINHKSVLQRIGGMMIPGVVFLAYLLISHSFMAFLDLCFLGLSHFKNQNSFGNVLLIVLFVLSILFVFYHLRKDKTNPILYYILGSASFLYPMCDLNHFACYFLIFLIFIFYQYDIKLNYKIFNVFLIILLGFLNYGFQHYDLNKQSLVHYPRFSFLIIKESKSDFDAVLKKYKEYEHSILISPNGMIYDVILNKPITFFDLPLHGNSGKLGTQKLINQLEKGTFYFIDDDPYNQQFDVELVDYIQQNSEFVEKVGKFSIYHYS